MKFYNRQHEFYAGIDLTRQQHALLCGGFAWSKAASQELLDEDTRAMVDRDAAFCEG